MLADRREPARRSRGGGTPAELGVLEIAPGSAAARYDLANLMFTLHRNPEVLPLVERLLATEPRNIDYLSLKAQTLRLVGRNDEAVALMEAAVADHPDEDPA